MGYPYRISILVCVIVFNCSCLAHGYTKMVH
jgi:hypothetical protein